MLEIPHLGSHSPIRLGFLSSKNLKPLFSRYSINPSLPRNLVHSQILTKNKTGNSKDSDPS